MFNVTAVTLIVLTFVLVQYKRTSKRQYEFASSLLNHVSTISNMSDTQYIFVSPIISLFLANWRVKKIIERRDVRGPDGLMDGWRLISGSASCLGEIAVFALLNIYKLLL